MSFYIRKNGRCALGAVGALIVLLLVCGLAFASGGGEPGGAHDSGKLLDLLYRAINFALLVIILYMVVKKNMSQVRDGSMQGGLVRLRQSFIISIMSYMKNLLLMV